MAIEQLRVIGYLQTVLNGDATFTAQAPGGAWRAIAPDGTATPFAVITGQGGHDVLNAASQRLMTNDIYQVNISAPATQEAAVVAAADRADALLQRTSGTNNGVSILQCRREQVIPLSETVNGQAWMTVRLLFRAQAQ